MARATIEDFKNRLEQIEPSLFSRLQSKESFSFRVNCNRANAKEVLALLEQDGIMPEPIEWSENVFTLPLEFRKTITKSKAYTQKLIYIQNLSSIFAALSLGANKDDWVLDLAAAPGGKSLIFSEQAQKVSAVEPDKSRFFMMKRNFKESMAKNIQTYNKDGRYIYKACSGWFDKVFLDAPCSSEAHIDIAKGITWWSPRRIYKFAKLQKELIVSAYESLKPNGVLIYATCTFAPEENEAVVNSLLKKYPNAKLLEIEHNLDNVQYGLTSWGDEEYNKECAKSIRFLPNGAFSGFYMAKIKKD
jgi:16S rRNA C967 or C1407 C5-methylase (RsmB/RsmF family)